MWTAASDVNDLFSSLSILLKQKGQYNSAKENMLK
jgi:hypothetical protein